MSTSISHKIQAPTRSDCVFWHSYPQPPAEAPKTESEEKDNEHHQHQSLLASNQFLDVINSRFVLPSNLDKSNSFFARQKAHHKDVIVPSGPEASAFATIFNLCKSMIGSGVLGLAFTMRYTGELCKFRSIQTQLFFRDCACSVHFPFHHCH
jgi:hypothetical protein